MNKIRRTPGSNQLKAFILACDMLEELAGRGNKLMLPLLVIKKRAPIQKPANPKVKLQEAVSNLLTLYSEADRIKPRKFNTHLQIVLAIHKEVIENPNISRHTVSYFVTKHGISAPTLNRVFNRYAHTTLHDFVMRECMKKANQLLDGKAFTSENIASELGYADKSGFLKAYKRFNENLIQKSTN